MTNMKEKWNEYETKREGYFNEEGKKMEPTKRALFTPSKYTCVDWWYDVLRCELIVMIVLFVLNILIKFC